MRATLLIAAVASVAICTPIDDASACGDKFLVTGRGVRFDHIQAISRPASVLLYVNPSTELNAAAESVDLKETLELAGHSQTVVSSRKELTRALSSGKFDVILADVADAPMVSEMVGDSPTAPVLLPVLHDPTRVERKEARKAWKNYLKTPVRGGGGRYVLATVDKAVVTLDKRTRIAEKKD